MRKLRLGLGVLASVVAAGCANEAQQLDQKQPEAIQVAVQRAKFELNCPAAAGQIINREMVQPVINAPMIAGGGVYRAEYTVGVTGCDQRTTYVVVCPMDGQGCFAGDGRR